MCQGQDSIILDNYVNYPDEGSLRQGVVGRYFYPNVSGTYLISWIMGNKTVTVPITVHAKPNVAVYRYNIPMFRANKLGYL